MLSRAGASPAQSCFFSAFKKTVTSLPRPECCVGTELLVGHAEVVFAAKAAHALLTPLSVLHTQLSTHEARQIKLTTSSVTLCDAGVVNLNFS